MLENGDVGKLHDLSVLVIEGTSFLDPESLRWLIWVEYKFVSYFLTKASASLGTLLVLSW